MHMNRQQLKMLSDYTSRLPRNKDILFFDIETTGFSPQNTSVYLIGCVYFENEDFHSIQWVAQNPSEEPIIIHTFFTFLAKYKTIVHFNGEGFDIPYLLKKCQFYQMPYNFEQIKSIDLYKITSPYKKHLKLMNLKQKTLEDFLDVKRDDHFNGKELISIYLQYQNHPTEQLLSILLQHNHDDLIGMMQLLPMLAYNSLFQGNITDCVCKTRTFTNKSGEEEQEAIFTFTCLTPLPKRISYGKEDYYLSCFQSYGKLRIKLYTGELKYFFPNYQDYYYLPLEDISIHKSVSFYVDSNFRTRAKAANCYSKKTGRFLPQEKTVISPYFKQDYHDKKSYFEVTKDFLNDTSKQLIYVKHILSLL